MKYQIIETIEIDTDSLGREIVYRLNKHFDTSLNFWSYDPVNNEGLLVITIVDGENYESFSYHFSPFQPINIDKMVEEIKKVLQDEQIKRANTIEEFAKLQQGGINKCNAEVLYNAGYHKTIWHKVADGDLPKNANYVLVAYRYALRRYSIVSYAIACYEGNNFRKWSTSDDYFKHDDDVIAWTELPEYKEI